MLAAHPNFWAKSKLPDLSGHSRNLRRSASQAVRDDSLGVVAHLIEGNKPTGLLWLPSRNRPAQVHSTSTARWRKCHPVFSQVDGLIDRRRLKSVLSSALFFADSTKHFRHRHHCRSRWVYASRERHGSRNNGYEEILYYSNPILYLPQSMELWDSPLL